MLHPLFFLRNIVADSQMYTVADLYRHDTYLLLPVGENARGKNHADSRWIHSLIASFTRL